MSGYTAYISDVSYYSGKLEAFLRYKEIPYRRVEINTAILKDLILPATGYMKVPVVQCPDGRWLKDTTPMLAWLDAQHPQGGIYPQDPVERFIALLVEDYADEWLWRPAMYYRWRFPDSHRLLRARLGRELAAGTRHLPWLLGWYMRWRQYLVFVRGDGVRPHNEPAVQALYRRSLEQLSRLLAGRPFLLGARPSIVDFGFFASMFRHFALDPAPARIMLAEAPAVYAWVGRLWNARASREGQGALESFDHPDWDALLGEIGGDYLAYLDANAEAYARGARRFDLKLGDQCYPAMPVVRYRVACREQLLKAYGALAPEAQLRARQRLERSGIARWLALAQPAASGLDQDFVMPLPQRYPQARGLYGLRLLLRGTPWDRPAPPVE